MTYVSFVVATILAIIMIPIAWLTLSYTKNRKELSYSKLADAPLVNIDTRVEREKIRVLYDKEEVKDVQIVLLKVWNSGRQDLKIYRYDEKPVDSFEKPYWFVFEGRTVIARNVLETEPPSGVINQQDLETYHQNPDSRTNAISLPHCALEPKKAFTLRVLLRGPVGGVKIEGKLLGCWPKEHKVSEQEKPDAYSAAFPVIFLVDVVGNVLILSTQPEYYGQSIVLFNAVIILVIFFVNWVSSIVQRFRASYRTSRGSSDSSR